MIPEFKFTLSNTTEGSLVIDEPLGWKEAVLKLDRDEKYHSLIEYFESSLTFYGTGLNYIRTVEINQGVDARIDVTIEIKFESTFETLFSGKIDIASAEETSLSGIKYKANYAIIRDDFWAKFNNRVTTPVDLRGTTDLYGGSVTAMQKKTLQLPSQAIRKVFDGILNAGFALNYDEVSSASYIQIDVDTIETDEIENTYQLINGSSSSIPVNKFEITESGSYAFNLRIEASIFGYSLSGCDLIYNYRYTQPYIDFFIQKNNDTPIAFSETNYILVPEVNPRSTAYTYSNTLSLTKGDTIRIYGDILNDSWESLFDHPAIVIWGEENNPLVWSVVSLPNPSPPPTCVLGLTIPNKLNRDVGSPQSGQAQPTFFIVNADTVFDDTECEGFLVHDVGKAIVDRIAGEDKFYSEYLGHTSYTDRTYSSAGCGWRYALAKGLHIRGYTLTQKSFFENFESWFESINAQWNMGLGYEVISSVMSIRVEEKEHFYDSSSNSADFYNVKLERVYDHDWIFKKIVIGYNKWKAESKGVIDDPQTKTTYSSRFESVGNEISLLSEYIAASLVWEVTRREKIEPGKDWKFDDDIFIMSLNPTEVSSGVFQPEILSPSFLADGILNKATRYNYRLWPMFNFMRWLNVFNGALDKYQTSYYKFVEGEGNYKCSATMSNSSDCIFTGSNYEFTQFEDIPVDILGVLGLTPVRGQYIHSHELYKATIEMSWNEYKLIQASRKKSIGISETDAATSPYFIKSLSWKPFESRAELTVWPKDAKVV